MNVLATRRISWDDKAVTSRAPAAPTTASATYLGA